MLRQRAAGRRRKRNGHQSQSRGGWREYVRGVYRHAMPGYAARNFFGASAAVVLPDRRDRSRLPARCDRADFERVELPKCDIKLPTGTRLASRSPYRLPVQFDIVRRRGGNVSVFGNIAVSTPSRYDTSALAASTPWGRGMLRSKCPYARSVR